MLQIKHPPDMALEGVKAVPHMAGRLMKGPWCSDNLFSVGLSVNHVDSISSDLTASGCAPSSISLTSEAGERKRNGETWINRQGEANNGWSFFLYDASCLIYPPQAITVSNSMRQLWNQHHA